MDLTLAQLGLLVLLVIIGVLFGMTLGTIKCLYMLCEEEEEVYNEQKKKN